MKYIYHVKQNADTTEGRGPMLSVAIFENEHDAIDFCEKRAKQINYRTEKWMKYGETNSLGFMQYTKEILHIEAFDEERYRLNQILNRQSADDLILLNKWKEGKL